MTDYVTLSTLAFRLSERVNAAQAICTAMTDSDIDPAEWLPGLEFVLGEIEQESELLKSLTATAAPVGEEAEDPSD